MKKNGDENWKKKVPKVEIATVAPSRSNIDNFAPLHDTHNFDNNGNTNELEAEVVLRPKKSVPRTGGKVGSLQERMSQLQTAQNSWQAKVGEKDVDKFTVAGKMATTTPNKRVSRKDSEMNAVNDEMSQSRNSQRSRKVPQMRRFHGSPPPLNDKSYDEVQDDTSSETYENLGVEVEVPDFDEDLDKFFKAAPQEPSSTGPEIDLGDFDAISNDSESHVEARKMNNLLLNKVKKPTNRERRSRNPVKALANRKDVRQTYHQQDKIVVSSSEMETEKGKKSEKNVHSHLAAEAKAALAATEDFTCVELKKDNKVVPHAEFVPYKAPGKSTRPIDIIQY